MVEKDIYEVLKKLGISPSHKGYDFTMTAVAEYAEGKEKGIKKPIGELYRSVAQKYGSTYVNVERSIRFVNQKMFINATKYTLPFVKEVFGTTDIITNSAFIALIYEYLKYSK